MYLLKDNCCACPPFREVLVSYRILYEYKDRDTNIKDLFFFLSSRKEMIAQQREYKKKKALKKAQRIKELEQEREDQKVKWQQFNNRAYSKNKKGQVCLLFVYTSIVKDHRILCSNLGEGKKVFLKVVCSPVTYLKCAVGYFVLSRPSFALGDFGVFLWGWACTYL